MIKKDIHVQAMSFLFRHFAFLGMTVSHRPDHLMDLADIPAMPEIFFTSELTSCQ